MKNATAGTARLTQNALHGLTYCPARQFEYFTLCVVVEADKS